MADFKTMSDEEYWFGLSGEKMISNVSVSLGNSVPNPSFGWIDNHYITSIYPLL